MRKLVLPVLIAFSSFIHGQEVEVKWQDNQGRAFSIKAPSGEFSYEILAGDVTSYNINGNVSEVGPVNISYNLTGKISKVGQVNISYNLTGGVSTIGHSYVRYNLSGQVSGTSGCVN